MFQAWWGYQGMLMSTISNGFGVLIGEHLLSNAGAYAFSIAGPTTPLTKLTRTTC